MSSAKWKKKGNRMASEKTLKGKVALITGGSRGIGRAITLKLADEGAELIKSEFVWPTWQQMREALAVPAVPGQKQVTEGPYKAERNPNYQSLTLRTNRPLINFNSCRQCGLCWLHCPDSAFDITPDGYYDVNLEYCNGCGICVAVCPVKGCINMLPEPLFTDNSSQWEKWQQDNEAYANWVKDATDR